MRARYRVYQYDVDVDASMAFARRRHVDITRQHQNLFQRAALEVDEVETVLGAPVDDLFDLFVRRRVLPMNDFAVYSVHFADVRSTG